MKVLLINPPLGLDKKLLSITGDVPPIGLMDIGTQLLYKNHDVKILDASVNRYDTQKTISKAIDYDPELIGITSTTSNYRFARKIAFELKKVTNIPIVLGGVHATCMPYECVQSDLFDYVVSGEADESFAKLIEAITKKRCKNISGISYKINNRAILNRPKQPTNLKKLCMRSWTLVNIKKIQTIPS